MATESFPIKSPHGSVKTANGTPAIPPKGEPEHQKKAAPAQPGTPSPSASSTDSK